MDWAKQWYEARLDEKADPESYDPLAVVAESAIRVTRMVRILAALREGKHPEATLPVVRHLRTAYWQTYLTYRQHDARFHRGWELPDWPDPLSVRPIRPQVAAEWSIEPWLSDGRWAAQTAFSTQLSVFHEVTGELRRSVRRIYNTTATLYVYEAERLAWALDPARKS